MTLAPARRRPRALVGLLVAVVLGCSGHSRQAFDPDDPFSDSFFAEEVEVGDSLDEIWDQPAPNVGPLASGDADTAFYAEHGDPIWGEGEPPIGDGRAPAGGKSFSEKASEAAVVTMSILFAAGMQALPYLIGAY
jgi:hypothetical protein